MLTFHKRGRGWTKVWLIHYHPFHWHLPLLILYFLCFTAMFFFLISLWLSWPSNGVCHLVKINIITNWKQHRISNLGPELMLSADNSNNSLAVSTGEKMNYLIYYSNTSIWHQQIKLGDLLHAHSKIHSQNERQ